MRAPIGRVLKKKKKAKLGNFSHIGRLRLGLVELLVGHFHDESGVRVINRGIFKTMGRAHWVISRGNFNNESGPRVSSRGCSTSKARESLVVGFSTIS